MDEKFEKYKLHIELWKWIIGSVLLVVITLIIDSGFKERTAGIQEMQAFDKYVEIILKADNIEERWKLAEFFSTVTPTDRLREKWANYKNQISADYEKFKILKDSARAIKEGFIFGKTSDAVSKLNKITEQLEPFEKKLATTNYSFKSQHFANKYLQNVITKYAIYFYALKNVLQVRLGVDSNEIVPEANFIADLGADDLDMVEIFLEIEKEFKIQIPKNARNRIHTVDEFVKYLILNIER